MVSKKIISIIFLIIGSGLLLWAFFMVGATQQFIEKGIVSQGRVIEVREHQYEDTNGFLQYDYAPVVEFATEENQKIIFASPIGTNPSLYEVNDEVSVIYDPLNPTNAKINAPSLVWGVSFFLGIIGLLFCGIGGGIIWYSKNKKKEIKRLKEFGMRVETDFKEVEENISIQMNGRSPFRIVSMYKEGRQEYVYYSKNLWYDPTEYVTSKKITVFVDHDNKKKYYMDMSFLPREK